MRGQIAARSASGIMNEPGFGRPNQVGLGGLQPDDSDASYAPFRDALLADPDVQCTVYHVTASGEPRPSAIVGGLAGSGSWFIA